MLTNSFAVTTSARSHRRAPPPSALQPFDGVASHARPAFASGRAIALALALLGAVLAPSAARADVPLEPLGPDAPIAERTAGILVTHWDGGETFIGRTFEAFGRHAGRLLDRGAHRVVRRLEGRGATREAFFGAVADLARAGYVIDVFLFAHGSPDRIHLHDGSFGRAELLAAEGMDRVRLVYTSTCWGGTLAQSWLDAGVRTYVASDHVNFTSWMHVLPFYGDWLRGRPVGQSVPRRFAQMKTALALAPLVNAAVRGILWMTDRSRSPAEQIRGSTPRVFGDPDLTFGSDALGPLPGVRPPHAPTPGLRGVLGG